MWTAFIWGIVSTSSLVLGGLIGSSLKISNKSLGIIMAFGQGVLISTIAYELVYESVVLAKFSAIPLVSFLSGALIFFFADRIIGNMGGSDRKNINAASTSTLVIPMVLGIIMDGIPESTVLGLGILGTGSVSMAMLIAIFISNIPEAIAGSAGMKSSGWSVMKITSLWIIIALICTVFTVFGYSLFGNASNEMIAFVNAFAGGAMLMMLANTMIPEAYKHGGKLAGVFTVLGFIVSVSIIILEHNIL
jgi:ZIP family zinc transporter